MATTEQPADLVSILIDQQNQIDKLQARLTGIEAAILRLQKQEYGQKEYISSEQIENVTILVERHIEQRFKRRMQAMRKVNNTNG